MLHCMHYYINSLHCARKQNMLFSASESMHEYKLKERKKISASLLDSASLIYNICQNEFTKQCIRCQQGREYRIAKLPHNVQACLILLMHFRIGWRDSLDHCLLNVLPLFSHYRYMIQLCFHLSISGKNTDLVKWKC